MLSWGEASAEKPAPPPPLPGTQVAARFRGVSFVPSRREAARGGRAAAGEAARQMPVLPRDSGFSMPRVQAPLPELRCPGLGMIFRLSGFDLLLPLSPAGRPVPTPATPRASSGHGEDEPEGLKCWRAEEIRGHFTLSEVRDKGTWSLSLGDLCPPR